jgi:phosphoserine phosphatase
MLTFLLRFLHTYNPHRHVTMTRSDLVASLQGGGVAVYLISGGFRQLIDPIQQQLAIPSGHVFANTILFSEGVSSLLTSLRHHPFIGTPSVYL